MIRSILLGIFGRDAYRNIKYTPRWLVFLAELYIIALSYVMNYLIFINSNFDYSLAVPLIIRFSIYVGIVAVFFLAFGTNRASIRYTSLGDLIKLALSFFSAHIFMMLLNMVYFEWQHTYIFINTPLVYSFLLGLFYLIIFRLSVKYVFQRLRSKINKEEKSKMYLLGTSDECLATAKALNNIPNGSVSVTGFLSLNPFLKSKQISGVPVLLLEEFYNKNDISKEVDGIIILDSTIFNQVMVSLVDYCMSHKLQIFSSSLSRIQTYSTQKENQLKKIQFEDLLFREPIEIDRHLVGEAILNKRVLITGGAGSIGSELARQICLFKPRNLILLDFAETPLFYVENDLKDEFPSIRITTVLGNICDREGMEIVFEKYRPEFVLHAAAYKHVPMMEKNPEKSFWINYMGTRNIVDLTLKYKVSRFVQVSTDKAVNPTNIMGLTKRLAELYVWKNMEEAHNAANIKTQFIITRFGNVLGSNGSVVPIFKNQIAKRKPITITDPEMTRYFMTIPEASRLVLQAASTGKSGEIYIFDMGEPVRILDMAIRLIRLSGLEPYKDIDIKVTGRRPGEKLYEELFNENCVTVETDHHKIFKVKEAPGDPAVISALLDQIVSAMKNSDMSKVMSLATELVPEFQHAKLESKALKVSADH